MTRPRFQGSFSDGLDLLSCRGYPVRVASGKGHLTLARWTEETMTAWLQYAPGDRGDGGGHADAHATLLLDGDRWRQARPDDGIDFSPLCGPTGIRFTEDMPSGCSGRIPEPGALVDDMSSSLSEGIEALNAAFEPSIRCHALT